MKAGLALLLLCTAPLSLAAQGSVHSATFHADLLAEQGQARVTVDFTLRGLEPGAMVPVSLLDFGAARATQLRVGSEGRTTEFTQGPGAARSALLPVDIAADGESHLTVRYLVPVPMGDGALVVHMPVVTVDLPPEQARPGLFAAQVQLPPTWAVTEGFPTGLSASGEAGTLDVVLQVVPSVVSFRARADGRWRPGLPFLLDLVALGTLVGFSLFGWRHLRASEA